MKKISYLIYFLITIILFCQCQTTEYREPVNTFHQGDRVIKGSVNFLADTTQFTSFLIENSLSTRDLDDIAVDDKSALLLFSSGHLVRLNNNGSPKMLIDAQGRGPGEFLFPNVIKVRNGKIFILDFEQSKIAKFDLLGNHLSDIRLRLGLANDFEILPDSSIVILNDVPQRYEGNLFIVFNQNGKKIDAFGNNKILQPILNKTDHIPFFSMNLFQSKNIILTSGLTGKSFLFSLRKKEKLSEFSIQQGPEWEKMQEDEKIMQKTSNLGKSFTEKVRDINYLQNGTIIKSWGGPFKGKKTVGMMFNKRGHFAGRIFGNTWLQHPPNSLAVENDSTIWVYSQGDELLSRVTF
ncbi:6-bladed beta-propeller [Fodinibius halophilus]|uniref:6-bladed beta-propeller n=1 Tax=Fodinibius halophilus TaxID=1736908 RepID=A0A6M1T7P1_9BACT|nr:6-bladed beta-propeller [Fodinibius halophilus]NGP90079.1 6-bladed beta-propeller [Fodinibius halophilus]